MPSQLGWCISNQCSQNTHLLSPNRTNQLQECNGNLTGFCQEVQDLNEVREVIVCPCCQINFAAGVILEPLQWYQTFCLTLESA